MSNQFPALDLYGTQSGITTSNPFIEIFQTRPPTGNDVNYPIQKRWWNRNTNIEYVLTGFTSSSANLQAVWVPSSGSGTSISFGLPNPVSPILPDSTGLVNFTSLDGSVTISGVAGGPGNQDINFQVSGTTNALQQIFTDSGTLTPAEIGSKNTLTINGVTVQAGLGQALKFIEFTPAVGQIQIQVASDQSTDSIAFAGVASFNSTQFTVVPTTGFVSLIGGAGPATLGIFGDDGSGDEVTPTSGFIQLIGDVVPTGTNAKPIFFKKNGTSIEELDVQVATTVTPTPANTNSCGVSCFDNNQFNIDPTSGMVSLATGNGFSAINVQVFTSSGTYTPSVGMSYCTVEVVGGGGGGGGSTRTSATICVGGGGGGGGYARVTLNAATVGASRSVTIGSGGSGGTGNATPGNASNPGNNGGSSRFSSFCIASGGAGGAGVKDFSINVVSTAPGGAGGSGSVGDIQSTGQAGGWGLLVANANLNGTAPPGYGGNSYFGGGAPPNYSFGNGNNGTNYGGGGSGGNSGLPAAPAANGGNGSSGVVIITEYI